MILTEDMTWIELSV